MTNEELLAQIVQIIENAKPRWGSDGVFKVDEVLVRIKELLQ